MSEVCGDEHRSGDLSEGLCFRELLDLTDNKCVELWETAPTVESIAEFCARIGVSSQLA